MTCKKLLTVHSAVIAVALLYGACMYFFDLGCLWHILFGIKCPTCGMTRALLALLQGDVSSYLSYHVMAVPVLLACLICLHIRLFRNKCLRIIGIAVSTVVLLCNIIMGIV